MLGFTFVLLGRWRVWAVLAAFWAIVFEFLQLLEDVSRHEGIEGAFIIIPFEVYATV